MKDQNFQKSLLLQIPVIRHLKNMVSRMVETGITKVGAQEKILAINRVDEEGEDNLILILKL